MTRAVCRSGAAISSTSFLEYAFVRWVLAPAVDPKMATCVTPQAEAGVEGRNYAIDYEIRGSQNIVALKLDGFAYHGSRQAFTYDRLRQNDLIATGRSIVRFSYDSIRTDTARCVEQLQAVLRLDPLLATMLVTSPHIEVPDMDPDPLMALGPSPAKPQSDVHDGGVSVYFESVAGKLNLSTLRQCQSEAFAAWPTTTGPAGLGRLASCRSVPARRPLGSWPASPSPGAGPWWLLRGA